VRSGEAGSWLLGEAVVAVVTAAEDGEGVARGSEGVMGVDVQVVAVGTAKLVKRRRE
jgi:hypothetical protein